MSMTFKWTAATYTNGGTLFPHERRDHHERRTDDGDPSDWYP
jgi:hypothetical protein